MIQTGSYEINSKRWDYGIPVTVLTYHKNIGNYLSTDLW